MAQYLISALNPSAFVLELAFGFSCFVFFLLLARTLFLVYRQFFAFYFYRSSPHLPPFPASSPILPSGAEIICKSPATGESFGVVRAFTVDEVSEAERRARVAQQSWKSTSFAERRALLSDLLDYILSHQQQICEFSVKETGKTQSEAILGEIMVTVEKLRWLIAEGEKYLGKEERPVATLLAFQKTAFVEYLPLGVVGIIVPWNYPFHNIVSHAATALFAGSAAIIKVSEYASFSASHFQSIFRTLFCNRGYSPELIQIITGYAETGAALVDSGIEKLLFIGSCKVGRLIMKQAAMAKKLTPVILELGGKDPFIIFDDCEFAQVVQVAIRGAFLNCGQNCISAERFYVQRGVYDKFITEVQKLLSSLTQGSTMEKEKRLDFGSITMGLQFKIVEELVEDAKKKGARVIAGGHRNENTDCKNGLFYCPTVLADVSHSMRISNEEAFGPVMSIIPFSTEEELLSMVNSTEYGLGSSVFTCDYTKATRIQRSLQSGMVVINDFAMVPTVQSLPFGGVKSSGFGNFNGPEGLRSFCHTQSVVTDRFPLRTYAPPFLLYPMSKWTPKIVEEALKMVYGKSYWNSALSLGKMVGYLMKSAQKEDKDVHTAKANGVNGHSKVH